MSLVEHAQRELRAIGCEEPERTTLLATVAAFSVGGWSGGSAGWGIATLERLLRFEPLTDLTCHPDEWNHICDERTSGEELWQSSRKSEAFSRDGGLTYYLLSERFDNDDTSTPMHTSKPVCLAEVILPSDTLDGDEPTAFATQVCGADAPVHALTLTAVAPDGTETLVGRKPLCDAHYEALRQEQQQPPPGG